jgi:hypothetical protein
MCFGGGTNRKRYTASGGGGGGDDKHQPARRGGVLKLERAVRYDFKSGIPFAAAMMRDPAPTAETRRRSRRWSRRKLAGEAGPGGGDGA